MFYQCHKGVSCIIIVFFYINVRTTPMKVCTIAKIVQSVLYFGLLLTANIEIHGDTFNIITLRYFVPTYILSLF